MNGQAAQISVISIAQKACDPVSQNVSRPVRPTLEKITSNRPSWLRKSSRAISATTKVGITYGIRYNARTRPLPRKRRCTDSAASRPIGVATSVEPPENEKLIQIESPKVTPLMLGMVKAFL